MGRQHSQAERRPRSNYTKCKFCIIEGSGKSDLRGRRANWALTALRGLFPTSREPESL